MFGLYLHIPFCSSICGYCNFNRGLFDGALKARYVEAIEAEIRHVGRPGLGGGMAADTIFFGGGTPSLLEPAEVARLITACREAFARHARRGGHARDQSGDRHDSSASRAFWRPESIASASACSRSTTPSSRAWGAFTRRGAPKRRCASARGRLPQPQLRSRCSGCPGQSLDSWRRTVDRAIALEPDHLSLYLLELYPNAPLKEIMARLASSGEQASEGAGWVDRSPMTRRRTCIWRRSTRSTPRASSSTRSPTCRVPAFGAGTTSSTGRAVTGAASGAARTRPSTASAGRTSPRQRPTSRA